MLAGAEFDDPDVGESAAAERILPGDCLDLLTAVSDRHDDPAIPWNLPSGHQEPPGRVVFFQEGDVRRHVRVDVGEVCLVHELDDEHRH